MGWIPSSATNVILNWPERIKTQPHDDRDNCFLHFDSKGPCCMTVNNDIDDDSATKHGDSHSWRILEDFHCQEYVQFFDVNCGLFTGLRFTVSCYDRRWTFRRHQIFQFSKIQVLSADHVH